MAGGEGTRGEGADRGCARAAGAHRTAREAELGDALPIQIEEEPLLAAVPRERGGATGPKAGLDQAWRAGGAGGRESLRELGFRGRWRAKRGRG